MNELVSCGQDLTTLHMNLAQQKEVETATADVSSTTKEKDEESQDDIMNIMSSSLEQIKRQIKKGKNALVSIFRACV